jgi:dCTP deaminase
MGLLSDVEILEALNDGSLVITRFEQSSLKGAGYDLRLNEGVVIPAGVCKLVATLERVELGDILAGTLHIRSTLARAGVMASLALVDPGFRGQLTILLFNGGEKAFRMKRGEKFIQLVFHRLGVKTRRPYAGKYQDSQGVVNSRS